MLSLKSKQQLPPSIYPLDFNFALFFIVNCQRAYDSCYGNHIVRRVTELKIKPSERPFPLQQEVLFWQTRCIDFSPQQ